MRPKPGDVVTCAGREGTWVAHRRLVAEHPEPGWYSIIKVSSDPCECFSTHHSAITLVKRPKFSMGQTVSYEGCTAVVVSTKDTDTIRVRYDWREETRGGGFIKFENREANVTRAALVLENFDAFSKLPGD